MNHEQFIHAVRDAAIGYLAATDSDAAERVSRAKVVYGVGAPHLRGVTIYSRWKPNGDDTAHPIVEICAFGEESLLQVAGTTIHELGHVLADHGAGHNKQWKQACEKLGLRCIRAAGTRYTWAMFAPAIRARLAELGVTDGAPVNGVMAGMTRKPGPCTAGIGTRGGKSRGVGSGSRLRKYVADCGQIVRASTDTLDATCNCCQSAFIRA